MNGEYIKRLRAAERLLRGGRTNRLKFEEVRTLVRGINPSIDAKLLQVSKAWSDYEKVSKAKYVELVAEKVPAKTPEEKKRKKALLLVIKRWKVLRGEVKRVRGEWEGMSESENKVEKLERMGRVVAKAKGTMGVITVVAVAVVAVMVVKERSGTEMTKIEEPETVIPAGVEVEVGRMEVLEYGDKRIPLSQVRAVIGPECDGEEHYHPVGRAEVEATDGELVADPDPGGCGFGKVSETRVIEVEFGEGDE